MKRGRGVPVPAILMMLLCACGGSSDPARTPTPVPTASATATSTATPPPTASAIATSTASATAVSTEVAFTPAADPTPSVTATTTATCACTATPSPVPTATPNPPEITYLGVARADDLIETAELHDEMGRPIFVRPQGQGMTIVLEARRGARPVAASAYSESGDLPDAQFLVSRPLGNGSAAVCDATAPNIGGVPGIDPPLFSTDPDVVAAINDLGCRVNDGTGAPRGRQPIDACTRTDRGEYAFVDPNSSIQFCLPIARAWAFPTGDTIVAARVRDTAGTLSTVREIVVRVPGDVPFACATGLGEHDLTPQRPGSAVLTSADAGAGDASRDPWSSDPLRLCAGAEIANGLRPMALRSDAVVGVPLADGSTLCVRLLARGSQGLLDCRGVIGHDVLASQEQDPESPIDVATNLGVPAGSGAASLRLPVAVRLLPAGSVPSDCETAIAGTMPFIAALTTAAGTAVVENGEAAVAELTAHGASFDCSAWADGTGAALVLPFPLLDTPHGDLGVALVLQD
jgi:hypothetical protein